MLRITILVVLLFLISCHNVPVQDENGNAIKDTLVTKGKITKIGLSSGDWQNFVNHIISKDGSYVINTEEIAWSVGDSVTVEIYSNDHVYLNGIQAEDRMYLVSK